MANSLQGSAMHEFIRSIFSEDRLHRFDHEMLTKIALTDTERRFLEEVGLPTDEILGWTFDPTVYGLRPVSRIAADRKILGFEDDYQIAVAGGQDVVASINVETERFIISSDLLKQEQRRFINSDLISFVACLAAYIDCCRESVRRNVTEDRQFVVHLIERIKSLDPNCLGNPDNWWSLIVEQMDTGSG